MFKAAVKNQNGSGGVSGVVKATTQQQSLIRSFKHAPTTQSHSTRPLTTGSGNVGKHTASVVRRTPSKGIKRTSSGLAKALSSQDDFADYPSLNISDSENLPSSMMNPIGGGLPTGNAPVFFDADDFDSDIDLDVEDLATKETVKYPKLPTPRVARPRDSGYASLDQDVLVKGEQGVHVKLENSSQPIPWSSSPLSHFMTPPRPKVEPPPKKRRTLPWNRTQTQANAAVEDIEEPEQEPETVRPKLRAAPIPIKSESTPLPKDRSKESYPWNTTASAVKQQQKSLREQNKNLTAKVTDGTKEEVQAAITKKKKNTVYRIFLSEEQQHVLNLVVEFKKSVFFTGSAGTGKSVLLREIISALRVKYRKDLEQIAVTASTGLAACNIGGVTLHSFSGIGLGKESAEDLVKKIRKNPKAKKRWLKTKVLIIDEVSMVDGELFDKLEQIARTIRNNGRVFGGIQLIITGDFFQLPPVGDGGRGAKFAFDAGTWTTSIEHTIGLHHVFRQKDPVFAGMLNEMREGRMTPASIASFRKLDRPLPASDDNIEATELFPTRAEVDRSNNLRMQQLHGDVFSFQARDGGAIQDINQRNKMLSSCIAPEIVNLKKGAQVMLIKNMDDTLVNGSLGKVRSFMTDQMFNKYKENEVAFLNGEDQEDPTEMDIRAQQKASLMGVNTQQVYPLVRFTIADGTSRDLFCKPESWKYEQPNGDVQASREQVPLILAWALSIHKAQGQTLDRVRVDLGRTFEKGQAYVALSRATSMAGLQVMRFDPAKVRAHDKVRSFYSSLSRAEQISEKAKSNTILGKMQRNLPDKKTKTDYETNFVGN